jgi:hypothetical protein
MIKVQPARSRVIKVETPDRIELTLPPKGFSSLGGLAALLGAVWLLAALTWVFAAFLSAAYEWEIIAAALLLPGGVLLVAGLSDCRHTWTLERTADALVYTRDGLWGIRVRSWTAPDISSLWVEETETASEYRCYLILGFRHGRSEEVLSGSSVEELNWLAAMLSDPRGSRRVVDAPALAAEPVRKRSGNAAIPPTLACRRVENGIEVDFLPLLGIRKQGVKLAKRAGLALGLILLAAMGLEFATGGRYPQGLTALAVLILLGYSLVRVWTLTRTASILIDSGKVTLRQNSGPGTLELKAQDIEFVQTFRSGRTTELQVLLREKPKLRLFEGRPPDELEWAARFLRVALKRRPLQESAPLRVDAKAGDCQVCGEKMESRVIYCAKCRTPHHEECWSYVGTCSTYGCREIRFTRA